MAISSNEVYLLASFTGSPVPLGGRKLDFIGCLSQLFEDAGPGLLFSARATELTFLSGAAVVGGGGGLAWSSWSLVWRQPGEAILQQPCVRLWAGLEQLVPH